MVAAWVIGMIINLCGNICINIGTNSIKFEHSKTKNGDSNLGGHTSSSGGTTTEQLDGTPNATGNSHSLLSRCCAPITTRWRRFLSHGRWFYVGWSVFTVGNVANFISLSFTPQSLLAGLGSSQFLMNAVCEWYFNGRNVTARMVKATVAIIIGNTLIVAFASHESPKLTVDELFQLLFEPAFDIYIVILLILTLILQIYYNETRKTLRTYQASMLAILASGGNVHINGVGGVGLDGSANLSGTSSHSHGGASSGGTASASGGHSANSNHHLTHHHHPNGNGTIHNIPIPTPLSPLRLKLLPFSYAAVSAIIGTQSVLLAKATSDLIRTSVAGNQQFGNAFTWVILVGWASTIVFWLYRMDTALRKFEGPFIVPVLQVVWTLFSIIGGGIYFQEFNKMDSLAIAFFTIGVCIMMGGVYLLAPQPTAHHHDHLHHHHINDQSHLSDIELGASIGPNSSPYEVRSDGVMVGGGGVSSASLLSPANSHHHIYSDHDSSGHSKEEIGTGLQHLRPSKDQQHQQTMVLSMAPPKITRVTSTGRMIIQNDARTERDVYVVMSEVSPEFRPFDASDRASYDQDQLTDDDSRSVSGGAGRTGSVDSVAMAMEKVAQSSPAHKPLRHHLSSDDIGVLGESGLLAGVGHSESTPPLRPAVQWGTPTRPTSEYSLSRPPSASGASHQHHSQHDQSVSSIPPSPSLGAAFDMYSIGTVKRSRALSLGFSMPMISTNEPEEQ